MGPETDVCERKVLVSFINLGASRYVLLLRFSIGNLLLKSSNRQLYAVA